MQSPPAAAPFCIPNGSAHGLQFLHGLASTCYFPLSESSHPHRCDVSSRCGLVCISAVAHDVEHLFMCHSEGKKVMKTQI